jgi:hypothetical protein
MATENRKDEGFSLVTVAALGVVTSLWIGITTSILLPSFDKTADSRYSTVVRSSAEAGLDWAVNKIQTGFKTGIDDTTNDGTPVTTKVDSAVIGNTGATVYVQVNNIAPPATSSIYLASNATKTNNGWRVVTASANYGGISKSIRVIMEPVYDNSVGSGPGSLFTKAAMGLADIRIRGSAMTDGFDSSKGAYAAKSADIYAGDVGSNSEIRLRKNAYVGGDIIVTSPDNVGDDVYTKGNDKAKNIIVTDQIKVNGTVDSDIHATNGTSANHSNYKSGGDNVFAEGGGTKRAGDYTTPIDTNQGMAQVVMPDAPASPSTAYKIGTIQLSGSAKIVFQNGAPAPSGDIIASKGTITLPPGDYSVSQVKLKGSSTMEISSGVSSPVKFYIEGSSSGSNVFVLGKNSSLNNLTNNPAKFQIMYNGTKRIVFRNDADIYTTVYAPNGRVRLRNGAGVMGAVVANWVRMGKTSAIHYDKNLSSSSVASTYGFNYTPVNNASSPTRMRTISWQEL